MEIYRVLQSIMEEQRLSVPDVARLSDLSDGTVRQIINRQQKTVALDIAFKLSEGLGVSLEYLHGEQEREYPLHPNIYLSQPEIALIRKLRKLDERGRSTVFSVITTELRYADSKGEVAIANPGQGLPSTKEDVLRRR